MPKYKANAKVLGLQVGETFESDDKFYKPFELGGYISVVDQEEASDEPSGEDD